MKPTWRAVLMCVTAISVLGLAACGGDDTGATPTGDDQSTPAVDESAFARPEVDTIPLDKAKKGDLIALPFYPDAGRYGGTKDVRGLDTYAMKFAILSNIHTFSPNVLIGSPGQEITLAVDKERVGRGEPIPVHDFRISDTPDYSADHEIVGEQWKSSKGTKFTLTFPDEGSVAFYCSYHLRINMAGMLIVK